MTFVDALRSIRSLELFETRAVTKPGWIICYVIRNGMVTCIPGKRYDVARMPPARELIGDDWIVEEMATVARRMEDITWQLNGDEVVLVDGKREGET